MIECKVPEGGEVFGCCRGGVSAVINTTLDGRCEFSCEPRENVHFLQQLLVGILVSEFRVSTQSLKEWAEDLFFGIMVDMNSRKDEVVEPLIEL